MKLPKNFLLVLLAIIAIIPTLNLLTPGLPLTHDGQDHVARIANFYESLSEGNIVPRWAGNLNWGYGHPILMFLYPLPSYLASLFHILGFSFVDGTKFVFALALVSSIVAMLLWLKAEWGTIAGFVGGILYGFAPYRFVDLYVRGALGEHVAFIFPPLVLLGIYRKNVILTSLSMAALILSHNAMSLMFLPGIFLYVLYVYFFERKKDVTFLRSSLYSITVGFLLSSFFWIPAFFEGKYTLRDIVTKGEFSERFVPWSWFVSSPWNYGIGNQFTKEIGFSQWLVLLISIILLFREKKRIGRVFLITCLIIFVSSLFLMTKSSTFFWQSVTLLQKFQFPWRLLSVTVFVTSVLGAFVMTKISKRFVVLLSFVLIFVSILSTVHMWKPQAYIVKPESFYSGVYGGTTDTGESSPIWSVRFMEHRPNAPLEIITGKASITIGIRTTTNHQYTVVAENSTRLVENTLYFPGWIVQVDGKQTNIEFQDPAWRGLMTFWVGQGEHRVDVVFGQTKLRKFADVLSIIGIVFLVVLYAKTRPHSSD